MPEVKVKGSLYLSRLKYLSEHASSEQRRLILEKISVECRAFLNETILPSGWYPMAYVDELMISMDAVLGKGDLALVEQVGRYSAEQAYRGIYKVFITLGSPDFVARRFPLFWGQLVSHGAIVLKKVVGDRDTIVSYEFHLQKCDLPFPRSFVLSLLGWTRALLEIAGAKNLKLKIIQYPRPTDPNCGYFSASWDK